MRYYLKKLLKIVLSNFTIMAIAGVIAFFIANNRHPWLAAFYMITIIAFITGLEPLYATRPKNLILRKLRRLYLMLASGIGMLLIAIPITWMAVTWALQGQYAQALAGLSGPLLLIYPVGGLDLAERHEHKKYHDNYAYIQSCWRCEERNWDSPNNPPVASTDNGVLIKDQIKINASTLAQNIKSLS